MKSTARTIAVIAPYFPPEGGGLERYAYEIASRLQKNFEWRVVVITSGERWGHDVKEDMDGLTVYRLSYRFKFSNTPFSLGWRKKIRGIFEAEQPHVINVHMPVPGIGDVAASLAGRIPVVVTYHAGSMNKKHLVQDLFVWCYEHGPLRILLRKANRIICASDFVRFLFLRNYLYKSATVTPGADSATFVPDEKKKSAHPTILFVAGLSRAEQHKGLSTLLNAASIVKKTVPDVRCIIVGGGDMRDAYATRAKQLGLGDSIVFEGRLARKALAEKYQEAHVFALPSSNENFSMAILEAMSSGIPVVATNVGGIPSLVEDGKTGFLVEPNNAQALAEKLAKILHNPQLADSFGKAARARITGEFDWLERSAKYNAIFMQALGKKVPHLPRLIIIAPYFFPKIGGLEMIAYNIARRLHESGEYRVSIVTSNHEGPGYRQDVIDGMIVHRLPILLKVSNTPIGLRWRRWMKRIFAAEQPDLLNLHSPVPFIADVAAQAAGDTPIVLTYHSGSMKKNSWPIDIFIRFYERSLLRVLFERADAIVASYPDFISREVGHFEKKIQNIPPGVDLGRFAPTPLHEDRELVTFVGRVEHNSSWKGIGVLLHAMARVIKERPQAKLEIVGGGDAVESYRAMTKELSIEGHVTFCGPQGGPALVEAYERTNVLVLPSTSDAESFGIVLAEAMASGRPVIGSDVGGIPRLIDNDKNGLLVPPKDPQALAAAIVRILGDRALAKRFAEASVIKAQQFSWAIQMEKYRALFSAALKARPAIAQIVPYYPPHLGGMEVVAEEIARELAKREYPVTVLTSDVGSAGAAAEGNTTASAAQAPHYKVLRLHSTEVAHTPIVWSLPFQLFRLPKNSILHVHIAQAGIPEVALAVAWFRNLPFIAHFHLDVGPSGPLGNIFLLYKKYILGHVLRAARKVIVFSEEQSLLVQNKYGVKESAIETVPNGVGEKFFIREPRKEPRSPLRLLYVGRLAAQKRVERLIEAMKILTIPAHLTIVGDGEDREKLEALARNLGLTNISFEGRRNSEELLHYYRNADIFLTASDREGMSLVALEAMASGLPVIGTNVIGTRELVEGAGILVEEPYPQGFADAIAEAAKSPGRLQILSGQSVERAGRYSLQNVVDKLEIIYKDITQ